MSPNCSSFLEELHTAVGDWYEAIGRVNGDAFDLMLTDAVMPGIDGLEANRKIRTIDAGVRVVIMTARAVETVIKDGLKEGCMIFCPSL